MAISLINSLHENCSNLMGSRISDKKKLLAPFIKKKTVPEQFWGFLAAFSGIAFSLYFNFFEGRHLSPFVVFQSDVRKIFAHFTH